MNTKRAIGPLFPLLVAACAAGQVQVQQRAGTWSIGNGHIRLEVREGQDRRLELMSLVNVATGRDWAAPGTAAGITLTGDGGAVVPGATLRGVRQVEGSGGAKVLSASFECPGSPILSELIIKVFPGRAVVEFSAALENRGKGQTPLFSRIDTLSLTLRNDKLAAATPIPRQHGFARRADLQGSQHFDNWTAIEQGGGAESLLIGGEMGSGMIQWSLDTESVADSTALRSGFSFRSRRGTREPPAWEITPGEKVQLPPVFLSLAGGDADDAANEAFRYLKQHVFPEPLEKTPLATYCVWLTHPDSEEILLDELKFARRMGFDVFYHDASWFEGSSTVPGTNDWSKGLGSYNESREKFPRGLGVLSEAVRKAGLKFGIWVDPGNVDSTRVESGEIPGAWVASIEGKPLETRHPSLAPMTQLCFGNPAVVAWAKQNLGKVVDQWNVEWLKWDPSGTVNYACNRSDHGHTRRNGLYAAYRGRMEILDYLTRRFPRLSGFECDPSLAYSRTNPGPREVLPGGYTNEFMTGPMVSPNVWGSLASAGRGDAWAARLTGSWYSASSLDYHLRKHFTHGVTFGNINGMSSQMLSAAPPGYIEAFKRNLLYFKQYRHLLLEDVYHPKLSNPEGWSAIEYAKADRSEAVLFVFRDGSPAGENRLKLRGLEPQARYRVTRQNDRPGRDQFMTGQQLLSSGLEVKLPDTWLAKGDGLPDPKFEDQLKYGSDVVLVKREPGGR